MVKIKKTKVSRCVLHRLFIEETKKFLMITILRFIGERAEALVEEEDQED